ncbi:hypothetical protein KEM55_005826 [Ascosphaera atra]|nr:hypothetical protein KEM55_005826 [Ascosphaera atra]
MPLSSAGHLRAVRLAALVSDEELDNTNNAPAPHTVTPSCPSASREASEGRRGSSRRCRSRGGPGKGAVHFTPQSTTSTSHTQPAPQSNPETPAHLVQGYRFNCIAEAAGGFTPIFSPEEMVVLNMERGVYTGLGPDTVGKSDLIVNYNCVRLQDDANFVLSLGEECDASSRVPEITPSVSECSNCAYTERVCHCVLCTTFEDGVKCEPFRELPRRTCHKVRDVPASRCSKGSRGSRGSRGALYQYVTHTKPLVIQLSHTGGGSLGGVQLEALTAYEEAVARGDDSTMVASRREVVNKACSLFKRASQMRSNAEQFNRRMDNLACLHIGCATADAAWPAVVIPHRT